MSLLNPLAAAVAAAIAIPALLALYFLRLRRRPATVSSTFLWRRATEDLRVNAPFQRLRRSLLLILQLLLLTGMILALGRPVGAGRTLAGSSTILLIDRSASMNARDGAGRFDPNGPTRLDEAKRRAHDLLNTLPRDGRAAVIAFDDSAEILQAFTSDVASLRRAVDSVRPTDRLTRLRTAYQLADAQLQFDVEQLRPNQSNDAVLLSDGRAADADALVLQSDLRYEPIGSVGTPNVGIVAASARRDYEWPAEVGVFARLANFGNEPVSVPVRITVIETLDAGPGVSTVERSAVVPPPPMLRTVHLLPHGWDEGRRAAAIADGFTPRDTVEQTVSLSGGAVLRIEIVHETPDGLETDDVAHLVVAPPDPLRVLLVTPGNVFLERLVMESLGLQNPVRLSPGEFDARPPDGFDVIVFDRHSPARLPTAGAFVYFGGVAEGLEVRRHVPGPDDPPRRGDGSDSVLDWDRDHPMLRGLSLRRVYAERTVPLTVPLGSRVLAEGFDGPLIVLHDQTAAPGRGRHLVIAFDLMKSNWPIRESFPHFLYNVFEHFAAGGLTVVESYRPGETPRLPASSAATLGQGVDRVGVRGPIGRPGEGVTSARIPVGEAADVWPLPPMDRVGLYALDPPPSGHARLAVNLSDEFESDLRPADRPPGGIGRADPVAATGGTTIRREWWWYVVAWGVLPLLFVEWWVYSRRAGV